MFIQTRCTLVLLRRIFACTWACSTSLMICWRAEALPIRVIFTYTRPSLQTWYRVIVRVRSEDNKRSVMWGHAPQDGATSAWILTFGKEQVSKIRSNRAGQTCYDSLIAHTPLSFYAKTSMNHKSKPWKLAPPASVFSQTSMLMPQSSFIFPRT